MDEWCFQQNKQKYSFLLLCEVKKINPKCKPLPDSINELILSDIPISCILLKSWTPEHKKQELSTYYYYCYWAEE